MKFREFTRTDGGSERHGSHVGKSLITINAAAIAFVEVMRGKTSLIFHSGEHVYLAEPYDEVVRWLTEARAE